jgi:hypothetical protein
MQAQQNPDTNSRFKTFTEFWPFYLGEHSNLTNRRLHAVGTTIAIAMIVLSFVRSEPWFLLGALFGGYFFAWVGHFLVEHNRPATFKYPFWSLMGDFKMYFLFVTGQLPSEIARAAATKTRTT